jgi:signal transduction histidine kinase
MPVPIDAALALPLADRPYVGHDVLTHHGTPAHVVQFYESDAFLAEVVADFLAAGGRCGEPMLVIATPEHRAAFEQALQARAVDVAQAQQHGQLTLLDARETLERIMVEGVPDPVRFEDVVGGALIACASGGCHAPVRAYGEMVDLLWRDANPTAALQLEQLWNGLAERRAFSLLCAYAMSGFGDEAHAGPFEHLCHAHSHVLPTEAYARLAEPAARLREVSQLQQRARALEVEIARRARVEQELREALRTREDFLSIAGHELKTPLTTLNLQLQALSSSTDAPVTRERVEVALRQARRLGALVEELLDVSHLAARPLVLRTEPVDLAALVRDVAAAEAATAERLGVPLRVLTGEPITGC